MEDIIIIAVIALILGSAGFYIYKAKKSGKKCIGCPYADSCPSSNGGKCGNSCGCGCCDDKSKKN